MRVCLIQCDPNYGSENIRALGRIIRNKPADLYVLPELFTSGYPCEASGWRRPHAEPFTGGPTYSEILKCQAARPESSIVYGFLENDHDNRYNSAGIVAGQAVHLYRQKCPANASLLHVIPGEFGTAHVGPTEFGHQPKIGLMICSDYNAAEAFFEEYSARRVEAVVLIADSTAKAWRTKFPPLCQRHSIPAVICNTAGPLGSLKGGSCIIDSSGTVLAELPETIYDKVVQLPLPNA